ncbi:helix-turn-helix domain-containing protein [Leisingera caerulea]|uniref:Helix-turn-helix domain-containing protein n=1 Tax=Leisingera caerulea TaxID=506591 RepID=A0A9Q9LYE6_LEICA|nr:helix-turn-helix domain-containing protein [Leisingera caerulea]UWQ54036.1 helix-turn-helix domain-containing protein [Leisingera caerulea]UWQ58627.1 helix-turn-helix domain-containing protein [Leisingera caerulea]
MSAKAKKANDPGVRLKTVKEVALEDNVSEKTVRRAISAGLLEVIRVGPGGRLLRIHPEAHAAYHRRCTWQA